MPPKASSRGEQVAFSLRHPNREHVNDIPGAKGCYYCWIREYDKCESSCKLVHRPPPGQGSSSSSALDAWDQATPFLTALKKQQNSVFDEMSAVRRIPVAAERSIHKQNRVEADAVHRMFLHGSDAQGSPSPMPPRSRTPPPSSSSTFHSQQRLVNGIVRGGEALLSDSSNSALYDTRSMAARRHPEIRTLHSPHQPYVPFKAPRGSTTIDVTPYTTVYVSPSAHAYVAHHRDGLDSGDAIWTGRLVKERRYADDERSQIVAARLREAKSSEATPSRALRETLGRSPARRSSTKASGRDDSVVVASDHVASFLMSGAYRSAMDLPLPPVFDPVAYGEHKLM